MDTPRELMTAIAALRKQYARRVGEDAAADLAGEALVRALERPPADGRYGGWLARIMRNLSVDRWRRATRHQPWTMGEAPDGPEDVALARERRRQVRRALAGLPRPVRRDIVRRFWSADPDPARPAVRTRVHRGLRRLRDALQGLRGLVLPVGVPALVPAAAVLLLLAQMPAVPVPAVAPAAPRPVVVARARPAAPPPAAQPRVLRFDFEDDAITGQLRRPDEEVVIAPARIHQPSLIEIPDSMLPSLIKSVDDL